MARSFVLSRIFVGQVGGRSGEGRLFCSRILDFLGGTRRFVLFCFIFSLFFCVVRVLVGGDDGDADSRIS